MGPRAPAFGLHDTPNNCRPIGVRPQLILIRGQTSIVAEKSAIDQRLGPQALLVNTVQQLRSDPDITAMAEHLYQLHVAGKHRGVGIAQVIFDTAYLPQLFAAPRGAYLKQHLHFLKRQPWVRHDEHYHIDFKVACGRM
jgi:hypothetical protein